MRTITPKEVKPRLTNGDEIAFIDVREAGQFGEGHPLFAVNIPYSRLELEVINLVPRLATPVVLLDDGDGVAEKAARRLEPCGYKDVAVMEGGAPGWALAGYTLFKGVNVPSKAFGEIVEHELHTPSLSAEELRARVARGDTLAILDGRTPNEYRRMTIPGARHCPNAELPHRIGALVPDPATTIVVNCAGRTRSIIGAENLRRLGLPNPVIALRNGTQGWQLAGLELERGTAPEALPDLDARAAEASRAKARELIARYRLPTIDWARFEAWRGEPREGGYEGLSRGERTTYLCDVRTAEEYDAGWLPPFSHAPGGQLVQATDQWIGVRGARIVLACDTGLRSATTAIWLRGMGHDAYVLDADISRAAGLISSDNINPGEVPPKGKGWLDPAELPDMLAKGAVLLDLRPSMEFRKAHIAGSRWAIRPRLERLGLAPGTAVILTRGDLFVRDDLKEAQIYGNKVCRLAGGPAEWRAAGLEVIATPSDPPDADCIDHLFFVHDRHEGNLEAARGYLAWEIALLDQLDAQERAALRPLAASI